MAESFDVDLQNEPEEANYQNIKGYYGNLSYLMRVLTIHELRQDFYQYFISLKSIYTWTAPYFRDDPKKKIAKGLKNIKEKIIEVERQASYNLVKSNKTMLELDEDLSNVKLDMVEEMKHANLLIGVREKGSDWLAWKSGEVA